MALRKPSILDELNTAHRGSVHLCDESSQQGLAPTAELSGPLSRSSTNEPLSRWTSSKSRVAVKPVGLPRPIPQ